MRQNTLDMEEARPEGTTDECKTRRNRFKFTIYRLLWVTVGVVFVVSKFALGFKYTTAASVIDLLCGLTGVVLYCVDKFHEDDPERWDWFFEADRRREVHLGVVLLRIILLQPLVLSLVALSSVCLVCCCFGAAGSAVFTALEDRFPQLPSAISMVFANVLTLILFLSLLGCLFLLWALTTGSQVTLSSVLIIPVTASPGVVIIISFKNALYEVCYELLGSFVFWATIMMPVPTAVIIRILSLAWGGRRALDTLLAQAKAKVEEKAKMEAPLLIEPLPLHHIRTAINTLGSPNESLTEDCLRAWIWFLTKHQSLEHRRIYCIAPVSFFRQLRASDSEKVTTWDKDFNWNSVQQCIVPIQYDDPQYWAIARVNFRAKHIEYYNNLSKDTPSQQAEAFKLLSGFVYPRRFWSSYEGWAKELICPSGVPQQTDTSNCGIFCCAVMERLLIGQGPTEDEGFYFTATEAAAYRQRMIQELESLIPRAEPSSVAPLLAHPLTDSVIHSRPVRRPEPVIVHGVQHPLE